MAWEESWALIVEEPEKINAHVLACEGRVNHNEGWMDVQTCFGFGLPSLIWLFSLYKVLVTVIPEEEMALVHSFVTTWLHGSLRS